jgi:hypothetical protein
MSIYHLVPDGVPLLCAANWNHTFPSQVDWDTEHEII